MKRLTRSDIWEGRVLTLKASPASGPHKGHNWPSARVKVYGWVGDKVKIGYLSKSGLDKEDDGTRIVSLDDLE